MPDVELSWKPITTLAATTLASPLHVTAVAKYVLHCSVVVIRAYEAGTHVELVLTQQTLRLRECVCLHCVIRRDAVFFRGAFMSAESIRPIRDGTG